MCKTCFHKQSMKSLLVHESMGFSLCGSSNMMNSLFIAIASTRQVHTHTTISVRDEVAANHLWVSLSYELAATVAAASPADRLAD